MIPFACWAGLGRLCYVCFVYNWCCGFHFTFPAIARGAFYFMYTVHDMLSLSLYLFAFQLARVAMITCYNYPPKPQYAP